MGVTYARGSIIGKSETREYDFLVDTGSTWMTLPPAEIIELELEEITGGRRNRVFRYGPYLRVLEGGETAE